MLPVAVHVAPRVGIAKVPQLCRDVERAGSGLELSIGAARDPAVRQVVRAVLSATARRPRPNFVHESDGVVRLGDPKIAESAVRIVRI